LVYSGNIAQSASDVFSSLWFFLRSTIFSRESLDLILITSWVWLVATFLFPFLDTKVTKKFMSYFQISYWVMLLIGLFLGGGYQGFQNINTFSGKLLFGLGFVIGLIIFSYLGAVLVLLFTKFKLLILFYYTRNKIMYVVYFYILLKFLFETGNFVDHAQRFFRLARFAVSTVMVVGKKTIELSSGWVTVDSPSHDVTIR